MTDDRTHGADSAINDDVTEHDTETEAFGSMVENLFQIMTNGQSLIAGLSDDVKPYLSLGGAGIDFTRDGDNTLYRLTLAVADEEAEVVQIGEGDAREGIAAVKDALALLPADAEAIPKLESLGEALADGVEGNPVADDAPRYVRILEADALNGTYLMHNITTNVPVGPEVTKQVQDHLAVLVKAIEATA